MFRQKGLRGFCGPEAPKWFLEIEFERRGLGWKVGHRTGEGVTMCVCAAVSVRGGGRGVFREEGDLKVKT